MLKTIRFLSLFGILIFFTSCATYYQKNAKFQSEIGKGQFEKAQVILNKNKKGPTGKNKVLYYMNDGWVKYMLRNYKGSIQSFETANNLIADQQKNYAMSALTLLTNPMILPYEASDVEDVMINYYKSLSFLFQNDRQGALIEARQITNKLYAINDKYKKYKNHYSDDAFAHVLIGLIYEASRNYNDAFIAYRNALKVYEDVYENNFGFGAPEQLKKDILRTASFTGFHSEKEFYEKKFGMTYKKDNHDGGYVVFLWENGFGPVKDEWSINFTVVKGVGGAVVFENEELGLSFPFVAPPGSGSGSFGDLNIVRVAFPKYLERKPIFTSAYCQINDKKYNLELAEDLNAIEFKTLNDKMLRTLASSLLRLATKKAVEYVARKENENVGAALGLINAITEKADTRNWQTLPHGISYVRIPVPAGESNLHFVTSGPEGQQEHDIPISVSKGNTIFYDFRSLESYPASN
ncbi:MAG: COG3014 family protein [Bacteroidales bacterium]